MQEKDKLWSYTLSLTVVCLVSARAVPYGFAATPNSSRLDRINQSIKLHPSESRLYKERAEYWLDEGSDSMALDDLNKAIELDPKNYAALHTRAAYYGDRKQWAYSARDNLRAALLGGGDSGASFANAGNDLAHLGRYNEAFDCFKRGLATGNSQASILMSEADLYASLGHAEQALVQMNLACGGTLYKPTYREFEKRAELLLRSRRYKAAAADLTEAMRLYRVQMKQKGSPLGSQYKLVKLLKSRAQCYEKLGMSALARRDLEESEKISAYLEEDLPFRTQK